MPRVCWPIRDLIIVAHIYFRDRYFQAIINLFLSDYFSFLDSYNAALFSA